MIANTIIIDGLCVLPSTFLHVRVSGAAVQIFSTQGTLHLGCDRPRFLFRDLQAGNVADLHAGMRIGIVPCDYAVESAKISHRREALLGHNVLPENVSLPKGTILLETATSADYHTFESLQIVGLTKHQRLIIGFAAVSYELAFSGEADLAKLYREAIKTDLLADHRGHFTALPNEAYLNWFPANRVPCLEIREIQHHPENWGSLQTLTDLRSEPSHVGFLTRISRSTPAKGIDL